MAKVILLEKVASLGNLGEQVTVSNGYARNYLIPFGKAVSANKATIAQFELKRAELEKLEQEKLAAAKLRAEAIAAVVLRIPVKASEEGRLYGSVAVPELLRAAKENGLDLLKNEIQLTDGPFRQLGDYELVVRVHSDIVTTLKIQLIADL